VVAEALGVRGELARPEEAVTGPAEHQAGFDLVLLDPAGDGKDLLDPAPAQPSPRRNTIRSMVAATVGRMNRWETFSPASRGSVVSLTSASRAELACTEVMPGIPVVT
jgi:hypothetical protein